MCVCWCLSAFVYLSVYLNVCVLVHCALSMVCNAQAYGGGYLAAAERRGHELSSGPVGSCPGPHSFHSLSFLSKTISRVYHAFLFDSLRCSMHVWCGCASPSLLTSYTGILWSRQRIKAITQHSFCHAHSASRSPFRIFQEF